MTDDVQTGALYIKGSATLVSMQQEMYKDALYFLGEAKKSMADRDQNPFPVWRALRAVILFSFTAIEACINQFLEEHLRANPRESTQINRLMKAPIEKKLLKGIRLYSTEQFEKHSLQWRDFLELKKWRNALVHFKTSNKSIAYRDPDQFLTAAEKAIKAAREIIIRLYRAHPANRNAYPPTFNELP